MSPTSCAKVAPPIGFTFTSVFMELYRKEAVKTKQPGQKFCFSVLPCAKPSSPPGSGL